MTASLDHRFTEFLLESQALKFGEFTLKAGNLPKDVDTVFGPAYKGIPLGVSTAIALTSAHGMEVGYTFDRKEKKDHGDGGMMVGTQHVNYHSDENRAVKSTIGFFRKK